MISKRRQQQNRNLKIYKLHTEEDFTYQEIANMYKISRARVGQIMTKIRGLTNA